jgi:bifunctional non-homologous end joining protein LigD
MSAGARQALRRELVRSGAPRAAVAVEAVTPMLAEVREQPFTAAGWVFELKYDGYRVLAGHAAAGAVRLLYRSGRDATALFPELARAVMGLPFASLVLDGEAVALDALGRPSFGLLQRRAQGWQAAAVAASAAGAPGLAAVGETAAPMVLFVFDLLAGEGFDLRPLPLATRRAMLRRVLAAADPQGPLRLVEAVEERGEDLFAAIAGLGLEGILAKRAGSPYRAGRSADWLKVRVDRVGDFAIIGYGPKAPADLRRLHLAVRAAGAWRYAGTVGSGLAAAVRGELAKRLAGMPQARPAAGSAAVVSPALVRLIEADPKSVAMAPALVCEVRYKEWTKDGFLRQPVFLRLRDDKRPEDCEPPGEEPPGEEARGVVPAGEEAPAPAAGARTAVGPVEEPASRMAAARATSRAEAAGVRSRPSADGEREGPAELAESELPVAISRPRKVFWPAEGYTKGDLARYYAAVAPWLLAYLRDRPLVLDRYPDGIAGKSFFQKHAPAARGGPVMRTAAVPGDGGSRVIEYFLCDDVESLLALVNLGAIPLHVWASRAAGLDRPDWCVLDLDPKGAPFANVVRIAHALRELCAGIGLPAFVKTSGGSGLHVLLPLGGTCNHEQSRQLAELLARLVVKRLPRLATTARAIAARGGKVYVDALQNGRGKLLASPFSVRPLPGAPVSTPLRWEEVDPRLAVGAHNLATVPERLRRLREDPLQPVLTTVPDLAAALDRLAAAGGWAEQ